MLVVAHIVYFVANVAQGRGGGGEGANSVWCVYKQQVANPAYCDFKIQSKVMKILNQLYSLYETC